MLKPYQPKPKYFNINFEPIVGKSCSLMNTLLDCNAQITIGDYVSFGHDVKLLTGSHAYELRMQERQVTSRVEPIVIKDGAWICTNAVITGGVTIGEHAVVGACALVLCDIPDNEMWGGVPATFIKRI